MIGTTIADRYELRTQIGIGGMGVVYQAFDTTLKRDVAIKVITPALMLDENARIRFLREAQALAGLSHPNIVTIHDMAEDTTTRIVFIVMELLRGMSLRYRMVDADRPPFSSLAEQICRALECAHSHAVLHRDIKPENIFVCRDGTIKLMDFGLARLLNSATTGRSGSIVGTVAYMAPEQLKGEPLDARADLYALGVLFYEYLGGTLPFDSDNPGSMLLKQLTETAPPLRARLSALPQEVEAMVMRLLEKDPAARFPSAASVREALLRPMQRGSKTLAALADDAAVLPGGAQPLPEAPVSTANLSRHAPVSSPPIPASGSRNRRIVLATGLFLGAAAVFAAGQALFRAPGREGITPAGFGLRLSRKLPSTAGVVTAKTANPAPDATKSATKEKQSPPAASLPHAKSDENAAEEAQIRELEKEVAALREKERAQPYRIDTPPSDAPPQPQAPVASPLSVSGTPNRNFSDSINTSARLANLQRQLGLKVVAHRVRGGGNSVRIDVQNAADCFLYFYSAQKDAGIATRLDGAETHLSAGTSPHILLFNLPESLAAGDTLILIASLKELTDLPNAFDMPPIIISAGPTMPIHSPALLAAFRLFGQQSALTLRRLHVKANGQDVHVRDLFVRPVHIRIPRRAEGGDSSERNDPPPPTMENTDEFGNSATHP